MKDTRRASDIEVGCRVSATSLWEPWATLMAIGAKKNETRSWSTQHRGALLICAAVRKNKGEMEELLEDQAFADALQGERASFGHAVALVDLDRCVSTNTWWADTGGDEFQFGDYSPGRFAWITTGLRRLKPFPVKGKQGIFYVTMPEFEELTS